jgi:hypothetical protein
MDPTDPLASARQQRYDYLSKLPLGELRKEYEKDEAAGAMSEGLTGVYTELATQAAEQRFGGGRTAKQIAREVELGKASGEFGEDIVTLARPFFDAKFKENAKRTGAEKTGIVAKEIGAFGLNEAKALVTPFSIKAASESAISGRGNFIAEGFKAGLADSQIVAPLAQAAFEGVGNFVTGTGLLGSSQEDQREAVRMIATGLHAGTGGSINLLKDAIKLVNDPDADDYKARGDEALGDIFSRYRESERGTARAEMGMSDIIPTERDPKPFTPEQQAKGQRAAMLFDASNIIPFTTGFGVAEKAFVKSLRSMAAKTDSALLKKGLTAAGNFAAGAGPRIQPIASKILTPEEALRQSIEKAGVMRGARMRAGAASVKAGQTIQALASTLPSGSRAGLAAAGATMLAGGDAQDALAAGLAGTIGGKLLLGRVGAPLVGRGLEAVGEALRKPYIGPFKQTQRALAEFFSNNQPISTALKAAGLSAAEASVFALGADSPEEAGQIMGGGATLGAAGAAASTLKSFGRDQLVKSALEMSKDAGPAVPVKPLGFDKLGDEITANALKQTTPAGSVLLSLFRKLLPDQHVYYAMSGEEARALHSKLSGVEQASGNWNGVSGTATDGKKFVIIRPGGTDAGITGEAGGHEVTHALKALGEADPQFKPLWDDVMAAADKALPENSAEYQELFSDYVSKLPVEEQARVTRDYILNEFVAEHGSVLLSGLPAGKLGGSKSVSSRLSRAFLKLAENIGARGVGLNRDGSGPVTSEALPYTPSFNLIDALERAFDGSRIEASDTLPDASIENVAASTPPPVAPVPVAPAPTVNVGTLNPVPTSLVSPPAAPDAPAPKGVDVGVLNPVPESLLTDRGQTGQTPPQQRVVAEDAAVAEAVIPATRPDAVASRNNIPAELNPSERARLEEAQPNVAHRATAEQLFSVAKAQTGSREAAPVVDVQYRDKESGELRSKRIAPYAYRLNSTNKDVSIVAVDLDRVYHSAKILFDWAGDKGAARFGYSGPNDPAFTADLQTYLANHARSRKGGGGELNIGGEPSIAVREAAGTLPREKEQFFSMLMGVTPPENAKLARSVAAIARIRATAKAGGVTPTELPTGSIEPNSLREALRKEGAPVERIGEDPDPKRQQSNPKDRNSFAANFSLSGFEGPVKVTGQRIDLVNTRAAEASFMPAATARVEVQDLGNKSWLSPAGEFFPLGDFSTHEEWARKTAGVSKNGSAELYKQGWARVTGVGEAGRMVANSEGGRRLVPKQTSALKDAAIFKGSESAQFDNGNSVSTIYNQNDAQFMPAATKEDAVSQGSYLKSRAAEEGFRTLEEIPAEKFSEWSKDWRESQDAEDDVAMGRFMPAAKAETNADVQRVSKDYVSKVGIKHNPHDKTVSIDVPLSKRIADFYEAAVDSPNAPEVKKAYQALANETVEQWKAFEKEGYTAEPWTKQGQPYANSKEMLADVAQNKHLFYFKTEDGFGSGITEDMRKSNPMLAASGVSFGGESNVPVNDVFRVVHDIVGHGARGYEFGPKGEFNAYLEHSRMFSPDAKPALAAETLAQNSWVNYGPHLRKADGSLPAKGEQGFIPATERPFAPQKNIVIPNEILDAVEAHVTKASAFMPLATKETFSKANVKDLPTKGGWVVFTAENPKSTQASPQENARRNAALEADLKANGLEYFPVKGSYGRPENSFIVLDPNMSVEKAAELARKYDQDSVFTRHGLVYQDGSVNPLKGVNTFETRPDDFYTEHEGTFFSGDIDFDTRIQPDSIEGQTLRAEDAADASVAKPKTDTAFMPALASAKIKDKDTQFKTSPKKGSVGGVLELVHFSSKNLNEIDPNESFGKGAATASDRQGANKVFFYTKGTSYEHSIATRQNVYLAKVDGNAIYDYNADPLNVRSITNREKRDQAIRDAGFAGFYVETDGFDAVALFEPTKVRSVEAEEVMNRRQLIDTGRAEMTPADEKAFVKQDARIAKEEANAEKLRSSVEASVKKSSAYKAEYKRLVDSDKFVEGSFFFDEQMNNWVGEQVEKRIGKADTRFMPAKVDTAPEGWVSTRVPTGTKAPENALKDNLIIGIDAMMETPDMLRANAKAIAKYPQLRLTTTSPAKIVTGLKEVAASNLRYLHDAMPEEVRNRAKLWYNGGRKIADGLAEKHSTTPEAAAGVIATLSPQKDWYMNVDLAGRVFSNLETLLKSKVEKKHIDWLRAKLSGETTSNAAKRAVLEGIEGKLFSDLEPLQQAMLLRANDEISGARRYRIVTPEGDTADWARNANGAESKVAWGDFGSIAKAVRIANNPTRANISDNLGQQHKVRNFYNNLLLPDSQLGDVTIDTHAVAAALLAPLSGSSVEVLQNFGGAGSASSSLTGAQGTYGIYADAYRDVAKDLGLLPRELQSITWEAVRGLFKDTFKTAENSAKISAIWKEYSGGKISMKDAQARIAKLAGGVTLPSWYEK